MAMHRNAGTPNLLEKNETNTLLLPVVGLDSRTTAGNTDYHLSLLYANNNNFDKFDIARGVPTFIRLSYKPPDSDGVKSIFVHRVPESRRAQITCIPYLQAFETLCVWFCVRFVSAFRYTLYWGNITDC
jgi:hypothetical protein